MVDRKRVLFYPLNSPGHINSSLGIADQMKEDYDVDIDFLVLGDTIGNSIREHGHNLTILEEVSPYENYEIIPGEDPKKPVDEEQKKRDGFIKKKYSGALKWPQILARVPNQTKDSSVSALDAFLQSVEFFEKFMIKELIDNHDAISKTIDELSPDLIVCDAYFLPPCVLGSKIPWVRLFSANPLQLLESNLDGGIRAPAMGGLCLYTKEERERIRQQEPERWKAILDEWKYDLDRYNKAVSPVVTYFSTFLKNFNIPKPRGGQMVHDSPFLNVYMFPKDLDYDQDDDLFYYPPRYLRCDSLVRKCEKSSDQDTLKYWNDELSRCMINKSQIVFFSLGSIASGDYKVMERFVDMFKDDDSRLYLISKGANGHLYELNPSNMLGGNYIPQTLFLQHSDIAIIHGGNNSITECMYYGLPMIVLPGFADQIDNAQRVEDLGYGKRLDMLTCTKEQLFEAIEQMSNNSEMIDKMRDIGLRMRSRNDPRKASYVLSRLMNEGELHEEAIAEYNRKEYSEIVMN